MDSSFNMDFILGNPISRQNVALRGGDVSKYNWVYENMAIDEKEERMLPDSSLSPSNQPFINFMMDESKFSDTECTKLVADKNSPNSVVSLYNKNCRLVIDSKGDEYLVAETHLVPIVDACKDLYDNPISSSSKECAITTTSESVPDFTTIDSKVDNINVDNSGSPVLENFLYASQLALVEVKLKDLETELLNLDRHSFFQYGNSAVNLRATARPPFYSQVAYNIGGNLVASDTELSDMDDTRRMKLAQIISKHSQLKKWLSKIKKKLKEKSMTKLRHIIDYSSLEQSELPLPAYLNEDTLHQFCQSNICNDDLASSSEDDEEDQDRSPDRTREQSCRLAQFSHIIDRNSCEEIEDENGNIIEETKIGSQAASKDGSDPEGLPNLSYEYESMRDSDTNYGKGGKSCCEDQVVSTDSDCLTSNQNPPTPDLRRAELDSIDISDGVRVLVVQTDYLRAAVIHSIELEHDLDPEGKDQKLWRVAVDGDRKGHKDMVLSEWQLLEQGVREVIPTSISQLSPGSRVCASWSEQLPLNLYPGTITLSSRDHFSALDKLPIDFDDGDHKDVDLDQVRLLPENFPDLNELMKASHFVDTNFYALDRQNRIRKKRITGLLGPNDGRRCFKGKQGGTRVPVRVKEGKRVKKVGSKTKKKTIVQWKLMKKNESGRCDYELVRNIDSLSIRAGDSVQLLSYSRHNYMANIVSVLARRQSAVMDVQLNWYYILSDVQDHSDVIKRLKKSSISKKVLFKTSHSDTNDVYSVLRKVEVLPFGEYRTKYLGTGAARGVGPRDSYVVAGSYDQQRAKVDCLDEDMRRYVLSGDG